MPSVFELFSLNNVACLSFFELIFPDLGHGGKIGRFDPWMERTVASAWAMGHTNFGMAHIGGRHTLSRQAAIEKPNANRKNLDCMGQIREKNSYGQNCRSD